MTDAFRGLRLAIFGLGRSGLGAVRLALRLGAVPVAVDEGPGAVGQLAALEELGAPCRTNWSGDVAEVPADAWVVSPGVRADHPSLVQARSLGLPVWGEVEFAYRAAQGPILAVTGTNGKSTTTAMAWLCAQSLGRKAWLCGNIAGTGYPELPLTEAVARAEPDDVLVAEISSFQLETVERFRPLAAAITQIRPDHLNRHGTMEAYAAAKNRIFAAMGPDDRAVAPLGDPWVRVPPGPEVLWFGQEVGDAHLDGDRLVVRGESVSIAETPIVHGHDRLNALVALCLATKLAPGDRDALHRSAEGLREFRPLTHRMEDLGLRRGVRFVNASMCTNPAAAVAVSRALGGRQLLLVGGAAKETPFAELGRHAAAEGCRVFVYGRDGARIGAELAAEGATVAGPFGSMREAFRAAAGQAQAGETVVLAPGCASFDEFRDFEERGAAFRSLVEGLGA